MTPEDKKIWDQVARTIKPLKKRSAPIVPSSLDPAPQRKDISFEKDSVPVLPTAAEGSFKPVFKPHQDRELTRKLRKGSYTIQATLDLHGQTQQEAYGSLKRFLAWALSQQFKVVLIITGKGQKKNFSERNGQDEPPMGVLRQNVPLWLENTREFPGILSISPARPQDGGQGALYVELKRHAPQEKT
ncbi:MAG: Smr/MutS family protein [Alphaproteobacteria bacterium]